MNERPTAAASPAPELAMVSGGLAAAVSDVEETAAAMAREAGETTPGQSEEGRLRRWRFWRPTPS